MSVNGYSGILLYRHQHRGVAYRQAVGQGEGGPRHQQRGAQSARQSLGTDQWTTRLEQDYVYMYIYIIVYTYKLYIYIYIVHTEHPNKTSNYMYVEKTIFRDCKINKCKIYIHKFYTYIDQVKSKYFCINNICIIMSIQI